MGIFSDISGFLRKGAASASLPLLLHNTLSGKKERFVPLSSKAVRMYHCGPTVYHYAHVGNLRSYVFADILRKTLSLNGYAVEQVINITDVGHLTSNENEGEDKMEKAVRREGKSAREIAAFYTNAFLENLATLNVETAGTKFPRATAHIAEQIALIRQLDKKGFTYKTNDGLYFDTSKFSEYGKLGGIDLKGLRAGIRVAQGGKKHPTDFALWKFSRPGEKRQQEWKSPWGVGFPGWHIECSAMSMKLLGESFDIHTGGIDHIPVHHNNEIAQSEAATGKPFVRYWLHNAFLIVGADKMGKSEDNFVTIQRLRDQHISPLALRYFFLGAHYRSPLSFSWDALRSAHHTLDSLYRNLALLPEGGKENPGYLYRFKEILNNDLNTPQALALIFDILRSSLSPADKRATIIAIDAVFGLDLEAQSKLYRVGEGDLPIRVKKLLVEREAARKTGDWRKSDELRKEIAEIGFVIEDNPKGARISKR